MVEIIHQYDIPKELQEEYLKLTREKIKPAWESRGCQAYDVWQATDDGDMAIMKRMAFEDMDSMKNTLAQLQTDDELKEAVDIWRRFVFSYTGRTSVRATRRIFIKKT